MTLLLRSVDFRIVENRDPGDGRTLEGYAAVFNTPTRIRSWEGEFDETIVPGAFKRSIESRTPVLQYDHGRDPRVGSVPIGEIKDLREDGEGLYVRARLYDNDVVEPVRQAIAGKSIRGMSFRFEVPDGGDTWTKRAGDVQLREIRDVDCAELGPVVFPAYDTTTVTVRSLLAQLDPRDREALVHEVAELLRTSTDLAGRPAQGAGGGDSEVQPRSGAYSGLPYDLIPKRTPK